MNATLKALLRKRSIFLILLALIAGLLMGRCLGPNEARAAQEAYEMLYFSDITQGTCFSAMRYEKGQISGLTKVENIPCDSKAVEAYLLPVYPGASW